MRGMATQFSMLGIMNAALVERGWDEIVSESDGTPEFRLLSRNWPLIVESELEDGAYEFTRKEATLATRIAGKFGFDDGYTLPAAALHVRNLWTLTDTGERCFVDWGQDGTAVYLDSTTGCTVEYAEAADPSFWSANFSRGVQMKLAAAIARGLDGEAGEAERLEAAAEAQFQRARTLASKSRAARPTLRRESTIAASRFQRRG